MIITTSVQTARARARQRHITPDAATQPTKPRIRVMAALAAATHETPAPGPPLAPPSPPIYEDDEVPFDPPDLEDLNAMGVWENNEEDGAGLADALDLSTRQDPEELPAAAPHDVEHFARNDPAPCSEPPSEERRAFEAQAIALVAAHAIIARPPSGDLAPAPASAPTRSADAIYEQMAPPIVIHLSWDRQDMGALFGHFATDRRMARAAISIDRGGVDGAILRFTQQAAPDLLILDSTLRARELLAGVDKVLALVGAKTKIFVVGAINDIALLRELGARGVKYVVPPLRQDDLARAVCGLYAHADVSRVIAVMGARGGIGASTLAHNLAWSIAERHDADVTLLDLDLAFGAAAFNCTARGAAVAGGCRQRRSARHCRA